MYGGHMLVYDTLHQTLITRRLEYLSEHAATNAAHPAVDRLLSRMVIALVEHAHKDGELISWGSHDAVYLMTDRAAVPIAHLRSLVELMLPGKWLYAVAPKQAGQKRPRLPEEELSDVDNLFDHNAAYQVLNKIATALWGKDYLNKDPLELPWSIADLGPRVSLPATHLPVETTISVKNIRPGFKAVEDSVKRLQEYLGSLRDELYPR